MEKQSQGPFPDGLLGDIDDYRQSLKVNLEELERLAAIEARGLAAYTNGAVAPEAFAYGVFCVTRNVSCAIVTSLLTSASPLCATHTTIRLTVTSSTFITISYYWRGLEGWGGAHRGLVS